MMKCHAGCGACCIAPSISSPIPGMPQGKPAGVRCAQLTDDNRCRLFGKPERPAVCVTLKPDAEMCGSNAMEATQWLTMIEGITAPANRNELINRMMKSFPAHSDKERRTGTG